MVMFFFFLKFLFSTVIEIILKLTQRTKFLERYTKYLFIGLKKTANVSTLFQTRGAVLCIVCPFPNFVLQIFRPNFSIITVPPKKIQIRLLTLPDPIHVLRFMHTSSVHFDVDCQHDLFVSQINVYGLLQIFSGIKMFVVSNKTGDVTRMPCPA